MRPGVKLAAFAVVLAAAFGLGAAAGSVAGPIDTGGGNDHPVGHSADHPAGQPMP